MEHRQRLTLLFFSYHSLEFLRDNIGAFGGSPSNITAFGHAGGAVSIEAHLFAWPEDPIVSAAICISGHLPMIKAHRDLTKESFSLIARRLGCPQHATPEEEVAFLRGADAGAILGCFRAYKDSDAEPQLLFRPQTDDVFIFSPEEQLERARKGQFAKVVSQWIYFPWLEASLISVKANVAWHDCG